MCSRIYAKISGFQQLPERKYSIRNGTAKPRCAKRNHFAPEFITPSAWRRSLPSRRHGEKQKVSAENHNPARAPCIPLCQRLRRMQTGGPPHDKRNTHETLHPINKVRLANLSALRVKTLRRSLSSRRHGG